jgi:hypothetical protein
MQLTAAQLEENWACGEYFYSPRPRNRLSGWIAFLPLSVIQPKSLLTQQYDDWQKSLPSALRPADPHINGCRACQIVVPANPPKMNHGRSSVRAGAR